MFEIKHRSGLSLYVLLSGLLLLLQCVSCKVAVPAPTNSPQEVLKGFVTAYNDSDAVKMATLVQGGNTSYDYGWTKGKSPNTLTITDMKIQIDGNKAHVDFTLEQKIAKTGFVNCSGSDSINLVVENGKWRIEKPILRRYQGWLSELAASVVYPVELDQEAKSSPTLNREPDAVLVGKSRSLLINAIFKTKPRNIVDGPPWGYQASHEGPGTYILFPVGRGDELYFLYDEGDQSVLSHWIMVNGEAVLKSQQRLSRKGSRQKHLGALVGFMLEQGLWFDTLPPKAQMLEMERISGLAIYQEDPIAIEYYCWAKLQNQDKSDFITSDDNVTQDSPEALSDGFYITKQESSYMQQIKGPQKGHR